MRRVLKEDHHRVLKVANGSESFYFSLASFVAHKSDCRTKHGAVVVHRGRVVSTGYNHEHGFDRHASTYLNNHISCHAECDALRNCPNKQFLRGADLYIVRINLNSDGLLNSEPCRNCKMVIENYMRRFGLRNVYYSV